MDENFSSLAPSPHFDRRSNGLSLDDLMAHQDVSEWKLEALLSEN